MSLDLRTDLPPSLPVAAYGRAATVTVCKTAGRSQGSAPHPGPPWEMEQGGHLLARAGKALPRNLRGRQGLASIDPAGRPLPSPENPG
jgi:hypothetical protein